MAQYNIIKWASLLLFSLSMAFSINAHAVTTTTTLTTSATTAVVGVNVTLTASVKGSVPTGTVTFKDGAITIGTATLTGTANTNTASLVTNFTSVGSHSITAVYAGNATNTTSTSSAKAITATIKATTTTLTTSLTTAGVGQSVTLTASVTGYTPTGTVTFKDGTATIGTATLTGTGTTGAATLTTSFSTIASHSITAVYAGDANDATSTSAAKAVTVSKASTTSTVTSNLSSAVIGQSVTLTASVNGFTPTGNITFKDGTTTIGTIASSGTGTTRTATITTSFTTAGAHSITVVYAGDVDDNTSTSTATTVTVSATATTSTSITSSLSTATVGQSVTLTASTTGFTPTGTVTFKDGATTIGTGTLSASANSTIATTSLITTFATVGTHSITAVYAGDTNDASSTSTASSITINAVATTTTLSVNPTTASTGQSVTLTATTTGLTPTGNIVFKDGTTTIGTIATTGTGTTRTATLTTSFAAAGAHSITASYAGDADDGSSTSSASSITVSAPNVAPTVSITAPANNTSFTAPASVTITANATDSDGTITKVDFYNGATLINTDTTTPYSYDLTGLAVGSYTLTAVATDNSNATTTSAAVTVTVNPVLPPSVGMTNGDGLWVFAPATFPLAVSVSTPNAGASITKVEYYEGANLIGTVTAAPWTYTWSNVALGAYSITAKATDSTGTSAVSSAINMFAVLPLTATLTDPASTITTGNQYLLKASTVTQSTVNRVEIYDGASLLTTLTTPVSKTITSIPQGGSISSTTSKTDSTWEYQWLSIPIGAHNVSVKVVDNNGGVGLSVPVLLNVTATNAPPAVSITAPANNATYITPASVTMTANAADTDGTITQVAFYNGATLVNTDTTAPYSYTLTGLAVGNYTLTAVATDNSNATTTSSVINIAVTTASTTTTLTMSPNPGIYNGNLGTTAIAATVTGTNPTGTVTFSRNGVAYGGSVPLINGVANELSGYSGLPPGSYTVTAAYSGDTNNAPSVSAVQTLVMNKGNAAIVFNVDTNPAAVGQTVNLTATVTPYFGGSIIFKDGAVVLGTYVLYGTGVASISTTFTAGTHQLTAEFDGGSSYNPVTSSTIAQIVSAPNVAPTISITAPANNTTSTAPASITLTATATDSDGSISQVQFYHDTTLLGTAIQQGATNTYSFNWNNVPQGSYTNITAIATDNSSNAASNSSTSAPIQLTVTAGVAQVYYIHTDQLNTPRLITNSANAKVWEWNNDDPFANNPVNDDPNATGNHFTYNPRLPGQYFDSETNTHYNYYRDYDPSTGRYIESDPIGLGGGINTYGYVGGNPMSRIDFLGLAPNAYCVAACGAVGAGIGGALGTAVGGAGGAVGGALLGTPAGPPGMATLGVAGGQAGAASLGTAGTLAGGAFGIAAGAAACPDDYDACILGCLAKLKASSLLCELMHPRGGPQYDVCVAAAFAAHAICEASCGAKHSN